MLKGTAAASLRHRNRAATTVLVCEQKLYLVLLSCHDEGTGGGTPLGFDCSF